MKWAWALVLMMVLISCNPAESDTIKVGVVLPLTGDGAFWGQHARNGMELALNDINSEGGINGKVLKLIIEDTKCVPKEGVSAMNKLIGVDKVSIVTGEACSGVALAMAPIPQENKIPYLVSCAESPDITKTGNYIFRTWTPTDKQAEAMVNYVVGTLNFERIAILNINNDFGASLTEAFVEHFEGLGGEITTIETYDQNARDFRTHLIKIKETNSQGVYMTSYPQDGTIAIKQMEELGMNIQILGTSGIDAPTDVYEPLGELSDGILVSNLEDTTTGEFKERYIEIHNDWPGMIACASVGYDNIQIIAAALREVGEDSEAIRDFLDNLEDYEGVSGIVSFDKQGDLDRLHSIFEVKDKKAVIVN